MIRYLLAQVEAPTNDCGSGGDLNLPCVSADGDSLQSLLALVFGVIAAVSIIIIMIAAINYTTGGGDPDKISRAKKTIIYALIGLVIAILAESIIYTVLGKL